MSRKNEAGPTGVGVWAKWAVATALVLLAMPTTAIAPIPARAADKAERAGVEIPFTKFRLDNGLTVIVHEDHKAPIVAVSVWYHVGSKNERPGKTGFAHLFEHLMFLGSENHDDEYTLPFEAAGATSLNGTTNGDRTNYYQNVPTPALDMALWMESDRMGHLLGAITQAKLDKERGVVQNEKRQRDNQPYGQASYRIQEGLYPEGHPYRWPTIGSMEDLDAAALDDVKAWFSEYYGAANAVLVMAGDIDAETARAKAAKYFGDIASGPPLSRLESWIPVHNTNLREVMHDRVPQARIYRVWAVPGRAERTATLLSLAASVLGGGKTSRLYKELVYDGQLAVNVLATVDPGELNSEFAVIATVREGVDAKRVEAAIDRVVGEFLAEGPTRDELERARMRTMSSRIRSLERVGGSGGKAVTLANGEIFAGDPGFYKTQLGWVQSAGRAEIRGAAADWLQSGHYQLTVLPFGAPQASGGGADRSALPEIGAPPALTFPPVVTSRLSNGIEVVLAERHAVPVVNVALQFDAGYAADQGEMQGVASFALEMLDEGTKTRGALEISAEAERLGASIGTGSSLDTSQVTLSAMKPELEASLRLFADVVRNPAFDEAEVERLRIRRLAAIRQEKSRPQSLALRVLPPLLYGPDHPYGVPFTGSGDEASISRLSRSDLVAFHRDWLRPENARLFVVGDTNLDEILPLLEDALGGWRAAGGARPEKKIPAVAALDEEHVVLIDKPGSPQTMILAGQLVPPTSDPGALTLEMANDILGGKFTARINSLLRTEKSWSYGAYSVIADARAQRPLVVIAPVEAEYTVEALAALRTELLDFVGNRPATEDELARSISDNVRSLPGRYETGGAVLGSLLEDARFGRAYGYAGTLKERFEAMNLDEVREAAHETMSPGRLIWVVIGDLSKIEAGVRALGLGNIEVRAEGSGEDK